MKVISCSLLSWIGCLCLLQGGCGRRDKDTSQLGSLPSLPVSLSEYCGHIDWQRSEAKIVGLPENIRFIRYTGELAWLEVFARNNELLYVRRKIFIMPSFFGDSEASACALVMLDVEKATKVASDEFGQNFTIWLYQAITAYFEGKNVDAQYSYNNLCIRVRREGDNLIVEYARPETMRALEKFAHQQTSDQTGQAKSEAEQFFEKIEQLEIKSPFDRTGSRFEKFPALGASVSEYCEETNWKRSEFKVAGLPKGIRLIRYTGEVAWLEVFVRNNELLYIRRKIYINPDEDSGTYTHTQIMLNLVMLDLEKATKNEASEYSEAFVHWMAVAIYQFLRGSDVDTCYTERDLSVCLRREGDDLILEYAKTKTIHALEIVAYTDTSHPSYQSTSQFEQLPALAASVSKYCGETNWTRHETTVAGLPEDVRLIRYTGEVAWFEIFAQKQRLLYVRRKIFFLPYKGKPGEDPLTIIMLDLEKATEGEEYSEAFYRWLRMATYQFIRDSDVDTRYTDGDIRVCVRRDGEDLVVEYARLETMKALEQFAHGQQR